MTRDEQHVPGSSPVPGNAAARAPEAGADDDVLMAVHEEVFRAWPSLALAIDQRRGDLKVRTWLRREADGWRSAGGGSAQLAGRRLDVALDWASRNPGDVTDTIGAYLKVARRQVWRRRAVAIAAAAFAVVALFVGVIAVQANDARQQSDALRIASDARAAFDTRLDLGLDLALQAAARSNDLGVQSTLLVGLTRGSGPRRYDGPRVPLKGGELDSRGTRAVMSGLDSTWLWDVSAGRSIASLPGGATAVAMSADASTAAIARPGSLEILRAADGTVTKACPLDAAPIEVVRLSARGDLAATLTVDRASNQSHFRILSTTDCSPRSDDGTLDGIVTVMDFDDRQQRLAFGTEDTGVSIVDLSASGGTQPLPPSDASDWGIGLDGEDGVAATSDDGVLHLWNARTGEAGAPIKVFDSPGTAPHFAGDGTVIVGANDGRIAVVDVDAQRPVRTVLQSIPELGYGGDVGILDLATTDTGAVTLDRSGRIITWDLTGRPALETRLLQTDRIDHLAGTDDGMILAAGGSSLRLLDGTTGTVVSRSEGTAVSAMAVGGGRIAIASGTSLRFGPEVNGLKDVRSDHRDTIVGVAIVDPDRVAAVDRAGGLSVGSTGASAEVALGARAFSIAATDQRVFVGMEGGQVLIVDAADPTHGSTRVDAHRADVTAMAIRPDGRRLATGSDDRSIKLWDIATGGGLENPVTLALHTDKVTSLAWSPDGRWLASTAEDHTVILWDAERGQPVGDPIAVSGAPLVSFLPGDRQLIVAGDGIARWDMRPTAWVTLACSIVRDRALNQLEQQRFLQGGAPTTGACP